MSGIAAAVRFDGGPVPLDRLQAMIDSAPHRRPDGCTIWSGACAALAKLHRLSLPGQSTSAQPAIDRDGRVAVFDGRLDNRSELMARASDAGLRDQDDDVLYVMAAMGRRDGGVGSLEGDFAFALWQPEARTLTAARDGMGMRPLYWMQDGAILLLASDIAQVLAAASGQPAPDGAAVTDILLSEPPTDGRTLYAGVQRLLPGEALVASPAGVRRIRYWKAEAAPPDRDRTDDDYADECRALLDSAVAARLRARAPVAVFFSGGIDSSSVLASALHLRGRAPDLVPLSIDYREAESAEREYRDEFAAFHGISTVELEPDAIDVSDYVAQAARRRMPPDLPSQFMGRVARREAAARGARVVLTGEAGDALFAGTTFHYADLIARGRLAAALTQYVRDWRNEESGWSPAGLLTDGVWPLLPQRWRERLRGPVRRVRGPNLGTSWVRGHATPRAAVPDPPRGMPVSTWAVAWELNRGWTWYFLEMLERDAAEWGIEPRHPMTDRRLVEFALRLPERQRRIGSTDKTVLRRAGRLPPRLAVRTTKAGLGYSMLRTLEALGGRAFLERLALADAGWVDVGEVLRGYDYVNRAAIPGDFTAETLLPRLWTLAALEVWMRGGLYAEPGRAEARAAAAGA